MKTKETINLIGSIFGITLSIFLISFVVFAVGEWTGPSATPPSENVSAPLNTGDETQLKTGALGVGGVLETNTLKITGGTPEAGKVLTTDADGLASWTNDITTTEITTETLKITGGTPEAGKVLTTDADGLASWSAPAASVTKGTAIYLFPDFSCCNTSRVGGLSTTGTSVNCCTRISENSGSCSLDCSTKTGSRVGYLVN
jgi:ribosomal protein S6E (S10)